MDTVEAFQMQISLFLTFFRVRVANLNSRCWLSGFNCYSRASFHFFWKFTTEPPSFIIHWILFPVEVGIKRRNEARKGGGGIFHCLLSKTWSSWNISHHFLSTAWLPEHFPSHLFANHMVTAFWLASCSSVNTIIASPPTHCQRQCLYKNCQSPSQSH